MIQKFVDRFYEKRDELRMKFAEKHISDYGIIVEYVIEAITDSNSYGDPDPKRIHVIDDGDYQGTLLYIIGAKGYQPSDYWSVFVYYGSCSGCDTLQGICGYRDEPPTEQNIDDYMTLALHIVQGLKEV